MASGGGTPARRSARIAKRTSVNGRDSVSKYVDDDDNDIAFGGSFNGGGGGDGKGRIRKRDVVTKAMKRIAESYDGHWEHEPEDEPLLSRKKRSESSADVHGDAKYALDLVQLMRADNPFLLSGFREHTHYDTCACLTSTTELHNDTMNIWTHLLACIAIALLPVIAPPQLEPHSDDPYIIAVYLLCAATTFFFSTLYHTFRTHSIDYYRWLLMFDVEGITLQVGATVLMVCHFELKCYPLLHTALFYPAAVAFAASLVYIPFLMYNNKHSRRTFVLLALSGFGFVAWLMHFYMDGMVVTPYNSQMLVRIVIAYFIDGLALTIRRLQIPERLSPGTFDIWFSSHQIFHVLAVVAVFVIYSTYGIVHHQLGGNECATLAHG